MLPEPFHFLNLLIRMFATYIFNHLSSLIKFGFILDIWIILIAPEEVSLPLQLLNFFFHLALKLFLHRLSRSILQLLLQLFDRFDSLKD